MEAIEAVRTQIGDTIARYCVTLPGQATLIRIPREIGPDPDLETGLFLADQILSLSINIGYRSYSLMDTFVLWANMVELGRQGRDISVAIVDNDHELPDASKAYPQSDYGDSFEAHLMVDLVRVGYNRCMTDMVKQGFRKVVRR